jgi:hypothetical protein
LRPANSARKRAHEHIKKSPTRREVSRQSVIKFLTYTIMESIDSCERDMILSPSGEVIGDKADLEIDNVPAT